jgi:hypothetical protein
MSTRMPLSEAALRLGMSYHQVRLKVLRGELPGGRDAFGRFYVSELPDTGPPSAEDADTGLAPVPTRDDAGG